MIHANSGFTNLLEFLRFYHHLKILNIPLKCATKHLCTQFKREHKVPGSFPEDMLNKPSKALSESLTSLLILLVRFTQGNHAIMMPARVPLDYHAMN